MKLTNAFEIFGLQPELLQAVIQMGFEEPTPIQSAAIPVLLEGRSVVGQAQTGTGKTAAFVLPMLEKIIPGKGPVQALILAPTRELAIQVAEATLRMGNRAGIRVLAVYGGQSYTIQTRALKRGVDVVVGTPGRLIDLIGQGVLDLSQVSYLVLDEADEMLEMGFIEDVEKILAQVPTERQTALFSATLPEEVRRLAERYLDSPQEIRINPSRRTVAETEQRFYRIREDDKQEALVRLLEAEDVQSALIFARTKAGAQELGDALARRGYPAEALHGDLNQSRREYVLGRFRDGVVKLLVATDVAARGLDIEGVSHVFNYDAPGDPEDYVHRIGRTGRAGRKGTAITFFTPRERGRMRAIESYTRQTVKESQVPGREEIQARRDARFVELLGEELPKEENRAERALLAQLIGSGYGLDEIALAAIRLARSGEGELPAREISAPVEERKTRRKKDWQGANEDARDWKRESRPVKRGFRKDNRQGNGREPGMVRLRLNLGETHGLRPRDVVGAIASETGIPGRAIGAIDIQREHSYVDVAENHVDKVLRESTGQYFLRGKPVKLTVAR